MENLPFDRLIPQGAVLENIIDRYGPLPESVRCGRKACRTPHKHGFLVLFSFHGVENTGVIGHICAKQQFGTTWKAAEKAYNATVNARLIADRVRSLMPAAEIVMPQIQAAVPRLLWLRDARSAIEAKAPGFFRTCADAVRRHRGYLGIPTAQGFKTAAHVEGGDFYVTPPPYAAALVLLNDLQRFPGFIGRKNISAKEIERRVAEVGNVSARWQSIEAWISTAERALCPEHLQPILEFYAEQFGPEIRLSKDTKKLLYMGYRPDSYIKEWVQLTRLRKPRTSSRQAIISTGPAGTGDDSVEALSP